MRFDGPTVALHNNGFGCGAMGLPDFSNMPMPAATTAAPRFMSRPGAPPVMPPPMKNPGLSLGLHQPDMLQLEPKPMYEMDLTQHKQTQHHHHHVNVKSKSKDEENESRSASGSENMGNVSGDEQGPPKKKRYHRHTARQIQEMEELFKECPHPDDKQRQELSRELGLEPRQVKFWFQNRRTQLKAQQERAENSMLRVEIEKLRAENITMREAIRHASCPNCGGPASLRDMSLEEQQLRIENACLKDELERVSAVAARFFGRSIPPILSQPPQFSSSSSVLNLSVAPNAAGATVPAIPPPTAAPEPLNMLPPAAPIVDDISSNGAKVLSDVDKSELMNTAVLAMEELVQLCQPDCPVWMSLDNSKDIFNAEEYLRLFPIDKLPGFKTDATRDSGLVMMNAASLADIFMDSAKWMELFSCNVSKALTLDVLCTNISGSLSGTLQLMYAELQVPSPLIQTREIYFLRYCKQLVDGTWAIVDVSVDGLRGTPTPSMLHSQKRPSGYLIHEMPDGSSKVVVVEHNEYDDQALPQLFRALVSSGGAFGAQRSLATLQRQCEGLANFIPGINSAREFGGIPNSAARQSLLKLSQRMTNSFCAGVGSSSTHTWTTLSGAGGDDVRVMTRKSIDNPGEPHGIVLSAATTIWLPSSPQRVFEYLRCEHVRNEWAVTPAGGNVQEIERIAKGQLGNDVSLFNIGSMDMEQNMFILQESSTDASGSLVVYAPVEVSTIKMMMQGGDPAHMAVLPSGFAVLPDGSTIGSATSAAPPTSNSTTNEQTTAGGSLLTVAVQILVSTMPSAKLSLESIVAINNLISSTVQKVKAAL